MVLIGGKGFIWPISTSRVNAKLFCLNCMSTHMIMLSNLTVMPKHVFIAMTIQLMTLYSDIILKKSYVCNKIIIGLVSEQIGKILLQSKTQVPRYFGISCPLKHTNLNSARARQTSLAHYSASSSIYPLSPIKQIARMCH